MHLPTTQGAPLTARFVPRQQLFAERAVLRLVFIDAYLSSEAQDGAGPRLCTESETARGAHTMKRQCVSITMAAQRMWRVKRGRMRESTTGATETGATERRLGSGHRCCRIVNSRQHLYVLGHKPPAMSSEAFDLSHECRELNRFVA